MVGVVPSYTVEYDAACTVWRGMQHQNTKPMPYKFQEPDSDFDRNAWAIEPPPLPPLPKTRLVQDTPGVQEGQDSRDDRRCRHKTVETEDRQGTPNARSILSGDLVFGLFSCLFLSPFSLCPGWLRFVAFKVVRSDSQGGFWPETGGNTEAVLKKWRPIKKVAESRAGISISCKKSRRKIGR